MNRPYLAGFDLSLSSTGFCTGTEIVTSKAISFKTKKGERLLEFYKQFAYLLDFHHIGIVMLENYAFNSLFQREALAELGGVLKLVCAERDIVVVLVPPTSLKKFATGKGVSKKEEIKLSVYKRWGAEFNTSDETDAYVLWMLGKYLINPSFCNNKYEKELIKKLEAELSETEVKKLEEIRKR